MFCGLGAEPDPAYFLPDYIPKGWHDTWLIASIEQKSNGGAARVDWPRPLADSLYSVPLMSIIQSMFLTTNSLAVCSLNTHPFKLIFSHLP